MPAGAVVESTGVIAGLYGPHRSPGAPSAGTTSVQTLTFGGTPTGGTFTLSVFGYTTAPITWSATNATLIANIDAALEALPPVGTGGVTTAAGSLTAGVGTVTLTFNGANLAFTAVPPVSVASNLMTGTAPTLAAANTTPGVRATFRDSGKGALVIDVTNGNLYQNTGSAGAPTWTQIS
jgi:hypothetical protein